MSIAAKNNEIIWINTLKGVCILLVVLHHSIITTLMPSIEYLSTGLIPAKLWVYFNKFLSPLRMPAFFFVSGLLSIRAVQEKAWPEVFTKKVSNLLYLYILWGVIQWILIKGVISTTMHYQLSDSENSAYAESLLSFFSLLLAAKTSLWYLYALAGYFLVAKLFNRYKYILLLGAAVLNYIAALGFIEAWSLVSVSQNLIYFLLGAFFSDFILKISQFNTKNILVWLAIFFIAVLNIYLGIFKNIFACVLAIIIAVMLSRFLARHFNMAWLNWIGKNTLQIYVIHRILVEALGISSLYAGTTLGWFDYPLFSLTWGVLFPPFALTFCTLSSLLIWHWINRGFGQYFFLYPRLVKK